jgi:ATP/maltotriose-dependent transcriptional regulator MalT
VAIETGSRAAEGFEALARADWTAARDALEDAVAAGDESPEVLDALGRAAWWLRDAERAVVCRERAYAGFRRAGELARAARLALWLSREYALVWRNDAAANGWLARAERLLTAVAPGAEQGWLDLARAERTDDPAEAARLARRALEVALTAGDPDLELRSLAQLGLAEVTAGLVDEGLARLDEAMAAATGGEPATLETFADVCCTLILACERAGDTARPKQWSRVFETFVRTYDHVSLLAFCHTCSADVSAANGRIDDAEQSLLAALRELSEAGQRARCVHPAARLAEIRVLQGRFDEAEQLLAGFEDEPEAVQPAVALRLARSEPEPAAALARARLAQLGRANVLGAPLLSQLVEAELAAGNLDGAGDAAAALEELAAASRHERLRASSLLARGRVEAAAGDPHAVETLERAVELFGRLRLELDAARARAALAAAVAATRPALAVDLARRAHTALDAMGATRDADAANALLRSLGAKGRSGPKAVGRLSRRELDVLRLLSEGLTNAQIAERLFISPKTAEHHVGRIYGKLGVSTRAEAAAYAARNLYADGVE